MHRRAFIGAILGAAVVRPQKSKNFDVLQVSQSVFAVRGKADSGIPTNSSIIVGDSGVAIVDTHQRPSLDREMIGIVKEITNRPIKYLINTHWHQDHTLGNQVFEDFAVIVGHEATRKDLIDRVVPNLELQRQVRMGDEEYLAELDTIRVAPPARVFRESFELDISRQSIELLHLGHGHTRGDIVIHLPGEETIILGDLVTADQPFMRPNDAVPSQWAPTLRKIAKLSWKKAVIGHGWVDDPRRRLDVFADYLETLVSEVSRAIASGIPIDRLSRDVTARLKSFARHFPYFDQAVTENILRTHADIIRH